MEEAGETNIIISTDGEIELWVEPATRARSLERKSVMTTGTLVSLLTGLSPAALLALWAAH